jgi:hypothetical protein
MASLPTVGDTTSTWGTVLNTFLLVAHNADGTLQLANAWTSWTPTVTPGSGSFTAAGGSNPSVSGAYLQIGKTMLFSVAVTFAANIGTAGTSITLSLPNSAQPNGGLAMQLMADGNGGTLFANFIENTGMVIFAAPIASHEWVTTGLYNSV